jgi:hypothetical protein
MAGLVASSLVLAAPSLPSSEAGPPARVTDRSAPTPQLFVTMSKPPIGIAVTASRVLVTQFNTDKVQQIDNNGVISNFATLPTTGRSVERYISISPGLGGFREGYVFVTVGQDVYRIAPDGSSVRRFVHIPSLPNGETGISFDSVGTFGNKMILTDRRGPVYSVTSKGAVTQIADVGAQIEGPLVVPLTFGLSGGQIAAGNEYQDRVFLVSNGGVVTRGPGSESPEGAVLIPPAVCNFGSSGGAYFIALKDQKQIVMFTASDFTGLNGDIVLPSELTTEINLWHPDGTVTQFSANIGQADLEGSAFAPCPGAGAAAGR